MPRPFARRWPRRIALCLGLFALLPVPAVIPVSSAESPDQNGNCPATAAGALGWGAPSRSDDFIDPSSLAGWKLYDAVGHVGNGRRTPGAISGHRWPSDDHRRRRGRLRRHGVDAGPALRPLGDLRGIPGRVAELSPRGSALARLGELAGRRRDRLHGDPRTHQAGGDRVGASRSAWGPVDQGRPERPPQDHDRRNPVAQLGTRMDPRSHQGIRGRHAVVRGHQTHPTNPDAPVPSARQLRR